MNYASVADEILAAGYARVRFSGRERDTLVDLRRKATEFFCKSDAEKRMHGSKDFNFGFRPYGRQYSVTPEELDVCESFAYWSDEPNLIPRHGEIAPFVEALRAHRSTVAELTGAILNQFAKHYAYPWALDFGPASYLEINWYLQSSDRDLLQGRHEDGHLLSYVAPDDVGLEIEVDGRMRPESFEEGEMLIMPGSSLTMMTGGVVPPMYHQVRNHHVQRRIAVLYFVNTPMQGRVVPYVVNESNRCLDVARVAREKCALFGKSEPPILA